MGLCVTLYLIYGPQVSEGVATQRAAYFLGADLGVFFILVCLYAPHTPADVSLIYGLRLGY